MHTRSKRGRQTCLTFDGTESGLKVSTGTGHLGRNGKPRSIKLVIARSAYHHGRIGFFPIYFDLETTDLPPLEPQQKDQRHTSHHSIDPNIDLEFDSFSNGQAPKICLGSIPELQTRIRTTSINIAGDAHIVSCTVSPITSYYGLEHSGIIFATISKANCAVISQLYASQNVQLRAFVQHSVLKQALSSHREKHPATLKVDINVYGVRGEAYEVGKVLASKDVTLQQPVHGLEGFTYYNPHFLHIKECDGEHVEETPQYDLQLPYELHSEEQSLRKLAEGTAGGDGDIEAIFNCLAHTQQLQKRAGDRGHQKEAIDFILRRESRRLGHELNLWDEHETDSGEVIYQHIITGTRRAKALEAQGGILADEMGLGKTVVALAVIASTLRGAAEFMREPDNSFNGAHGKKRSKATLVIAPSSLLLDSWISEIYKHTFPGYLKYAKYHGPGRLENADSLYQSDIVLTTYATISSEIRRGKSMLGTIEWFRIVLDEAHDIRNRNTRQFEVASSLAAAHRWCLTGTPIQNSLEDLGALVAFLRIPLLENALTFQRFIINQSKQGAKHRFKNLRTLLGSICLRRTKEIIGLADPVQEIRELAFTPIERDQYNELLRKYDALINMGIDGAVCTGGGHMLSGCLHLVCDDCYIQRHSRDSSCPKCIEYKEGPIRANALRENYPPSESQGSLLQPMIPVQQFPTKLLAFVEDIGREQGHKSIAFSSWTKTLKLVCQLLEIQGLPYYLVHGGLPLAERHQKLDAFQCLNGANILLMTLGTGTVGLNLAAASRIYLLEPQWNPSVEQQAFGRALRLGQTEQVTIISLLQEVSENAKEITDELS
ncbi:SNF2 family N-terminal domain-containing protein [Apiospora arundinis]|uniref:SNF2 family N-terminal domain-containing protein n=1 Tax=Apiospora arundinis TaxID=335852 RepID=A0ABR2JMG6_9PEZI